MLRDDQRIEEIRLVEVGAFDDCTIKFPKNASRDSAEIHIFTGENGSGKSTLLYALASLFLVPNSSEHPLSELKLRYRSEHAQISANYFGRKYHVGKNALNLSGGLIGSERLDELSSTLLGFQNARNRHDAKPVTISFLPLAYSGQRSLSATESLVIREIVESPLQNHLSFGASVFPERILQWIANIETQSALALKDKDQKAADSYRDALNAVTSAVNEICEDNYSFALQRKPLNVVLKRGDLELDFDVLPDGLKSIISWIADVLMRMDRLMWANPDQPLLHQPLILFLDEIDIHLHPKWQRRVLPVVQKLFPNAQIFVSTHSPFVVGSVRDAWVYDLDKKGKEIMAQPAGAGHSYEVVLEDIFGIKEHFDTESQSLLSKLKDERRNLLQNLSAAPERYINIARQLSERSEELDAIVSADIRQLAKHGRKIELMEAASGPV